MGRWRSYLRRSWVVGVLVSAVIIGVLATRLDWAEFALAIRGVRWGWVMLAGAAFVASISLRALRWHRISEGSYRALPGYWKATVIGYVGNSFYPGRAGEILRVAVLHFSLRVPPGDAMVTAFADRLADLALLSVVALVVFGAASAGPAGEELLGLLAVLALIPILFFAVFMLFGSRLNSFVAACARALPGAWSDRIPRWYGQAWVTAKRLSTPRTLAAAVGLTAVAYLADYTALWLVFAAFGWSLPFDAAIVTGVFIAFGSLLPAAPGYVGVYQLACVLALRIYDIEESSAVAYSVVAQVATLLVVALLGVFAAMFRSGRTRLDSF